MLRLPDPHAYQSRSASPQGTTGRWRRRSSRGRRGWSVARNIALLWVVRVLRRRRRGHKTSCQWIPRRGYCAHASVCTVIGHISPRRRFCFLGTHTSLVQLVHELCVYRTFVTLTLTLNPTPTLGYEPRRAHRASLPPAPCRISFRGQTAATARGPGGAISSPEYRGPFGLRASCFLV